MIFVWGLVDWWLYGKTWPNLRSPSPDMIKKSPEESTPKLSKESVNKRNYSRDEGCINIA